MKKEKKCITACVSLLKFLLKCISLDWTQEINIIFFFLTLHNCEAEKKHEQKNGNTRIHHHIRVLAEYYSLFEYHKNYYIFFLVDNNKFWFFFLFHRLSGARSLFHYNNKDVYIKFLWRSNARLSIINEKTSAVWQLTLLELIRDEFSLYTLRDLLHNDFKGIFFGVNECCVMILDLIEEINFWLFSEPLRTIKSYFFLNLIYN